MSFDKFIPLCNHRSNQDIERVCVEKKKMIQWLSPVSALTTSHRQLPICLLALFQYIFNFHSNISQYIFNFYSNIFQYILYFNFHSYHEWGTSSFHVLRAIVICFASSSFISHVLPLLFCFGLYWSSLYIQKNLPSLPWVAIISLQVVIYILTLLAFL